MASLTTDEPSLFPLIAQETGQVHTVNEHPALRDLPGVVQLHNDRGSNAQNLSLFHLCSLGVHVEAT